MLTGDLPFPLNVTLDDSTLRPLSDLARGMRVSRGFLQLCIDAGWPTENGVASAGQFVQWLIANYEEVRALAGLETFPEIGGLTASEAERLRTVNALLTQLEYSRRRASHWQQKRHLRRALEKVSRLGDTTQ